MPCEIASLQAERSHTGPGSRAARPPDEHAPQRVELEEEELRPPLEGQVLVQTRFSAISPGTEMLFYRGLVPENMPLDATIPALRCAPGLGATACTRNSRVAASAAGDTPMTRPM